MPSLAGMPATSPVPQARSMDPNRPTRRTPLRDRNERRVKEKSRIQRPKTRLGLPIFTLATDRAPEPCVVIVVMRSLRF